MALDNRMALAAAYVRRNLCHIGTRPGPLDLSELINDAANIYGGSYDEYCEISDYLDARRFLFA